MEDGRSVAADTAGDQAGELQLEEASRLMAASDHGGLTAQMRKQLHDTLDELHVTQEELRRQNEELAATRASLEAERQRYFELFALAPDGYLETDLSGVVREANHAAGRLLAIRPEYLLHKPLAGFITAAHRRGFSRRLLALSRTQGPQHFELPLQPRSGPAVPAALSVVASRDERGAPTTLRWMVRDISARVRAEEEVRLLNEQLEQRVQERTAELRQINEHQEEYLRIITHDLRQPLTVLQGLAQMVSESASADCDQRTHTVTRLILESTRRLAGMISDLAETVSLDAGRADWQKVEVDLSDYLCRLLEQAMTQAQRPRVQLDLPSPGPRVLLEPSRFERAVINLLTNAIKYSPREAPVVLCVRADERQATVSVLDHGPGIAAEDRPHLFQRYFRARTNKKVEGLGLGLYITRLIVEAHGGRIWMEGEAGQGSTFSFTIPLA